MFSWNDTISKMNKESSLKGLLKKLKNKLVYGKTVVLIYTTNSTIGLSQLVDDTTIEKFVEAANIEMIYIKTPKGKWEIYLNNYDTYHFNNNNDNTLTIEFYGNEKTTIKF